MCNSANHTSVLHKEFLAAPAGWLPRIVRSYSLLYVRAATVDLTAPARIRHAAIRLFGEEGFDIGLRAIAEEAGVSLGLIRHHFGSKAGLREACDAAVLGELRRLQDEQGETPDATGLLERIVNADEYLPVVQYVVRALGEGGALAKAFWEQVLADSEAYLEKGVASGAIRPSVDPAGRARVIALMKLGALLLEAALAPEGEDFIHTWRRHVQTMTLPGLELFTHGLLTDSSVFDAYRTHVKEHT